MFSGDNAMLLREMAEEAPIIELVNNLLSQAVDLDASDIHVEPAEEAPEQYYSPLIANK